MRFFTKLDRILIAIKCEIQKEYFFNIDTHVHKHHYEATGCWTRARFNPSYYKLARSSVWTSYRR